MRADRHEDLKKIMNHRKGEQGMKKEKEKSEMRNVQCAMYKERRSMGF
jgi:hypothetical protein